MTKRSQSLTGLVLAAAMGAGWLVIHFAGIFGFQTGAEPWWVAAVMIAVQCWLSTGLFIVAHDAMHGSLAPSFPHVETLAGRAALMIYAGLDYRQMTPKHFDHHKHVGTGADPDFNAADPLRFWPWLVRFFTGYYTHSQILRIGVVAALYMLLGASLLNIVLFWAIPALLALGQLFYFGTYLPHRHGADAFADRHRARSTALPDWLSLITCFHFGGYHHEHHLYPGTPWWRLPSRREPRTSANARSIAPRERPNSSRL